MKFFKLLLILNIWLCSTSYSEDALRQTERPNILLITVDDMNWDSIGAFGSTVNNITPNIDRLATEGIRFQHAHVTVAVCWPSRAVWLTGLYPHHNGTVGFREIFPEVDTLPEQLKDNGYFIGLVGKNRHVIPSRKKSWDMLIETKNLGEGRDPELYYQHTKEFLNQIKENDKPFFLMINSHDPHRPFAGSKQEQKTRKHTFFGRVASKLGVAERLGLGKYPAPPVDRYHPDDVSVPKFLPDLPDIRLELAEYYTSVHRADKTVGSVLLALKEMQFDSNTLVLFLSDNGVSLPFSKTNSYLHSTRAGLIARWPNNIKPNTFDSDNLINGIDLTPTILDAANISPTKKVDGVSFLQVLLKQEPLKREHIYTYFDLSSNKVELPMRSIQDKKFGYIFNAWSNGENIFRNEPTQGRTMKAMVAASKNNSDIKSRVDFFLYRTPEEFYDYETDPDALNNLIENPKYASLIQQYREQLLQHMENTEDPQTSSFKQYLGSK